MDVNSSIATYQYHLYIFEQCSSRLSTPVRVAPDGAVVAKVGTDGHQSDVLHVPAQAHQIARFHDGFAAVAVACETPSWGAIDGMDPTRAPDNGSASAHCDRTRRTALLPRIGRSRRARIRLARGCVSHRGHRATRRDHVDRRRGRTPSQAHHGSKPDAHHRVRARNERRRHDSKLFHAPPLIRSQRRSRIRLANSTRSASAAAASSARAAARHSSVLRKWRKGRPHCFAGDRATSRPEGAARLFLGHEDRPNAELYQP